jgi:hypothetical protein
VQGQLRGQSDGGRAGLAGLVAAVLVALLAADRAPAAPLQEQGTLVAVPREDAAGTSDYFLRTGSALRPLRVARPPRAAPGARVRVTGEAGGGGRVAVRSLRELAPPDREPVAGTRSVLVMLVTWTGPDGLTPAAAADQIASRTSGWFAEVSGGRLALTATATPWLAIPPTDCEDILEVRRRALAAARAAGFEPAAYDHEAIVTPPSAGCAWAGRGAMPGGTTWFNGSFDTRVTVHELGHNLGLNHAASAICADAAGAYVAYREPVRSCAIEEYGDAFDAMGASRNVGHYNAAHKRALGWLGGDVAELAPGDAVALAPYVGGTGVRAASVRAGGSELVVEYRRPAGLDAFLTAWPQATSGVLVHDATEGPGARTYLLDAQPDGLAASPALEAGRVLDLPGGLRLRVDATGPEQAIVSLLAPQPPPADPADAAAPAPGDPATRPPPGG